MNDLGQKKEPRNLSWWLVSLAMSVVLCAIFAGYVFDIKEDLHNAKIRAEIMEQRLDMLSSQLDNMRRRLMVQQVQIVAPEKTMTAPAALPEGQNVAVPATPNLIPVPLPANEMPPKH